MSKDDEAKARERARIILNVRAGKMTATQAAKELGVSRKTYYEWEGKALKSMMNGLLNGEAGRPAKEVDQEKELLKSEIQKLKEKLIITEKKNEIMKLFYDHDLEQKKKKPVICSKNY